MFDAWLNYNTTRHNAQLGHTSEARPHTLTHAVYTDTAHPVLATAVQELRAALPSLQITAMSAADSVHSPWPLRQSALVMGTCGDTLVQKTLVAAGLSHVCPMDSLEAYTIRSIQPTAGSAGPRGLLVGGGPAGVLYGAFSLIKDLQMGMSWGHWGNRTESPSTSVRLLNHWSQFRGFPFDAWSFVQGRSDSIFSWEDLRQGGTALDRIKGWARLLASVGINAIAPCDVNYDERNNFLNHLGELAVLGAVLRPFAIRLYWTPDYLLAPLQSTADALYTAVPDFGGYLLKIGSEKQGGVPDPKSINVIASHLIRKEQRQQKNGTVLLRGFIYGSDFHYAKKSRIAIPASFFGPYDGKYLNNVHIMGKYSPLDFETVEPINPLDGLLKKTKYGPEVVVGKDFFMSWVRAWEYWLNFDTKRGTNGTKLGLHVPLT